MMMMMMMMMMINKQKIVLRCASSCRQETQVGLSLYRVANIVTVSNATRRTSGRECQTTGLDTRQVSGVEYRCYSSEDKLPGIS